MIKLYLKKINEKNSFLLMEFLWNSLPALEPDIVELENEYADDSPPMPTAKPNPRR